MTREEKAALPIADLMDGIGRKVRAAAGVLALSETRQRNHALQSAAAAVRDAIGSILQANQLDLDAARNCDLSAAMLDRLMLDEQRIDSIAAGLDAIAAMPDPLQRIISEWQRPNGLLIQRVSVPLGVIGIIYESRPNVTADAAALCIKAGNGAVLRGGSESVHSSEALYLCIRQGLKAADLPADAIQLVPTTDRAAVGYLLSSMTEWIDVVVPRGGKSLVRRVAEDARVPVIGHLDGICHIYVHESADLGMARDIVVNAKMRRTGICGAAETLLLDESIAAKALPEIVMALRSEGCVIRGDEKVRAIVPDAEVAEESDWSTEYLDAIISVRIVDGIDTAIEHIATHGSGHTEAIIAKDSLAADRFFRKVDSAIVLHNASTQFADGGEFGMGAEIGIATGRIHARGPVGANELTSYKYVVRGTGQVRS